MESKDQDGAGWVSVSKGNRNKQSHQQKNESKAHDSRGGGGKQQNWGHGKTTTTTTNNNNNHKQQRGNNDGNWRKSHDTVMNSEKKSTKHDAGTKQENSKSSDLIVNNFWSSNFQNTAARIDSKKYLDGEYLSLNPPRGLFNIREKVSILSGGPKLYDFAEKLCRNWFDPNIPETIKHSSLISIFFFSTSMNIELRIPNEEINACYPPHSNPSIAGIGLRDIVNQITTHYPIFSRIPIRPNDSLLKISSVFKDQTFQGFTLDDPAPTRRVIDFHYNQCYLYLFDCHKQWNQMFIPEFFDCQNYVPMHHLTLICPPNTFPYLTDKLYLRIENIQSFESGNPQILLMTSDKSQASTFSIKNNDGVFISFEDITSEETFTLWINSGGVCFPLYLSDALTRPNHLYSFPRDSGNIFTRRIYKTLSLPTPSPKFSDVLEAIVQKVPTVQIEDLELSELFHDKILIHPYGPILGIRDLSLLDALNCSYRLFQHLKTVPRDRGLDMRFDLKHANNRNSQIPFGCRSSNSPTILSSILGNVGLMKDWKDVVYVIRLDIRSFLSLPMVEQSRCQWLKKLIIASNPRDILIGNPLIQEELTQDLLKEIEEYSAASNHKKIFSSLHDTERSLLEQSIVRKSFHSLNLQENTFLEFASTNEENLYRIFDLDKKRNGRTDSSLIKQIGQQILRDLGVLVSLEQINKKLIIPLDKQRKCIGALLDYFQVDSLNDLGFSSPEEFMEFLKNPTTATPFHDMKLSLSSRSLPSSFHSSISMNSLSQIEELALVTLLECPILDNLYERSKWGVLFQSSLGSLDKFLLHTCQIEYVEIARRQFLRLPNIPSDEIRCKARSYLQQLKSLITQHTTEGADISTSRSNLIRHIAGILVGIWINSARQENFSEILEDVTQLFSEFCLSSSSQVSSSLQSTSLPIISEILEIIPATLTIPIGEVLVQCIPWNQEENTKSVPSEFHLPHSIRFILLEISRKNSHPALMKLLSSGQQSSYWNTNANPSSASSTGTRSSMRQESTSILNTIQFPEIPSSSNQTINEDELISKEMELSNFCKSLAEERYLVLKEENSQLYYTHKEGGGRGLQRLINNSMNIIAQDLYSNMNRYLYELIQNADDCQYSSSDIPLLKISFSANSILTLEYNELGFTMKNIEAISGVNDSTKVNNNDQGGKKGIGFKSVFMISDQPEVHSRGYHFKFNEKGVLGYLSPIHLTRSTLLSSSSSSSSTVNDLSLSRTLIRLPLRRTLPKLTTSEILETPEDEEEITHIANTLKIQLKELEADVILFLRRLKIFEIYPEVLVEEGSQSTLTGCSVIRFHRVDNFPLRSIKTTINSQRDEIAHWILANESSLSNHRLIVPEKPVEIAIPLQTSSATTGTSSSGYVYVLLPTRSYGLPFHINAPFEVPANREDILDPKVSKLNSQLLQIIPKVFLDATKNILFCCSPMNSYESISNLCKAILRAIPLSSNTLYPFKDIADEICRLMCLQEFLPVHLPTSLLQHHLGTIIHGIPLRSPMKSILMNPLWKDHFDINDIARVVSAPSGNGVITKYLIDLSFDDPTITTSSIPSNLWDILQVETLTIDRLLLSTINLLNHQIRVGIDQMEFELFSRLFSGIFQIVSSMMKNQIINKVIETLRVPATATATGAGAGTSSDETSGLNEDFGYIPRAHIERLQAMRIYELFLATFPERKILEPRISCLLEMIFDTSIFSKSGMKALIPDIESLKKALHTSTSTHQGQQYIDILLLQRISLIYEYLTTVHDYEDTPTSNETNMETKEGPGEINPPPTSTSTTSGRNQPIELIQFLQIFNRKICKSIEFHFSHLLSSNETIAMTTTATPTNISPHATNIPPCLCEKQILELYNYLTLTMKDSMHSEELDHTSSAATEEEELPAEVISHIQTRFESRAGNYQNTIGWKGEEFIFKEMKRLYPNYLVIWENEDEETGLPYDLTLMTTTSQQLVARIEVKTTSKAQGTDNSNLFELSINEAGLMTTSQCDYWIARVYSDPNTQQQFSYDLFRYPYRHLNEHSWQLYCAYPLGYKE